MKEKSYFFIQPQVIGSPAGWRYSFYTNGWRYWTKEKAIEDGAVELGHDDFCVAEEDGKTITALYNSDGKRRTKESEEDEIKAILKEFGGLPTNPNQSN